LNSIFQPFEKSGPGDDKQKGSGLGLAIVKKWTEFHNGSVWAESEGEGEGTTIHITLPRLPSEDFLNE